MIFQQIWSWISDNITPILSSATFTSLIGFLVYFIKTRRTVGENTTANTKLTKELTAATGANSALKKQIDEISERVLDMADAEQRSALKLDGILSILEIVYANLKPEVASRVIGIATNLKYAAGKTRTDIAANLDAVKAALDTAAAVAGEKIKDTRRIVGKDEADKVSF